MSYDNTTYKDLLKLAIDTEISLLIEDAKKLIERPAVNKELESAIFKDNGLIIKDVLLYSGQNTTKDVIVPKGVIVVDDLAFVDNHKVETIFFPEDVAGVRFWAFNNCTNLKSVTFKNPDVEIDKQAFFGTAPESIIIGDKPATCKQIKRFVEGGMSLENYKVDDKRPGIKKLKLLYEVTK